MDQKGLTPKDLIPCIGQLNRVYEILAGKRRLTLPMIRKLNEVFGIPLEFLVRA